MKRRERGAALLTAMIIVTLVATLAASMVWQQWRAVQVEAAERARGQSAWILSGALDWARLILKEDARSTRGIDHLGEPWAVPLAEARLSTFLAADKSSTDDAPDAFLSGAITDAQGRYNLLNLVAQGKVNEVELEGFAHLCEAVGAPSDAPTRIAAGLLSAQAAEGIVPPASPASGASGAAPAASAPPAVQAKDPAAPLMPRSVAQLGFLGIDAETQRLLAPYVVILPRATPVNVNTASREVLLGAIKGLDLASAERLIQVRQRNPFHDLSQVAREVPALAPLEQTRLAVNSSFFEVRGRLRLADRVLEQVSLIERRGLTMVVLRRERVSSLDPGTS
jgi:general secretion pathway protein K